MWVLKAGEFPDLDLVGQELRLKSMWHNSLGWAGILPSTKGVRSLPLSTIQTDLARAPAAVGLVRVLLPSDDSLLQVEKGKSHKTRAFIRLSSERCRSILLALLDSGNLCRADIISVATFWALKNALSGNRCWSLVEPLRISAV